MAQAHHCELCGRRYYRRNLIEVWSVRAEGARMGWNKRTARICLSCQPERLSLQLLRVAHVPVTVRGLSSRRKRA